MVSTRAQALTGAAVAAVGGLLAWGARGIPSDAGYSGVGPNFLPWVVALALMACGGLLMVQALRGGWKEVEPPTGEGLGQGRGDWPALAWMASGVLVNAGLISTAGFVISCALCFALAVRGLRLAEGAASAGVAGLVQGGRDLVLGAAIALPVYWIFTKLLGISLPGLTGGGWL